jgi:hypothetical protein
LATVGDEFAWVTAYGEAEEAEPLAVRDESDPAAGRMRRRDRSECV